MSVVKGSRYERTYDIVDETGRRYLSRRRPMSLPPAKDDITYEVQMGDTLWIVAGLTYQKPEWYWVVAEYNSISSVFEAQFSGLTPGSVLKLPTSDRINTYLGDL